MSKVAKTFVVISIVWLVLVYVFLDSTSMFFNMGEFLFLGGLPLIIGWGIFWIRRK